MPAKLNRQPYAHTQIFVGDMAYCAEKGFVCVGQTFTRTVIDLKLLRAIYSIDVVVEEY